MFDVTGIDCLVIGAGFCGSVIARKLAEQNRKVLVLERRGHIAGNMYDEIDANGILVQRYGPHIFHTNNEKIIELITKYDTWFDYHLQCAADLDGIISPAPFNFKTIDLLYTREEAALLKDRLEKRYGGTKLVTVLELLECNDVLIRSYAEKLFELDYRPYTSKQWGIPPEEIDPSVLKRVPIRLDYHDAYFDDAYQVLPKNGYTHFFKNLLAHENIKVLLDTNALNFLEADTKNGKMYLTGRTMSIPVVYTGAVDELLNYQYGRLPYRSLRFEYQTKDVESFQDAPVVAYPKADGYTRVAEYKKLPVQDIPNFTTVAYEYPLPVNETENNEPYYPVLTNDSTSSYQKYFAELSSISNLFLCGRLAEYKYYNMDAVVLRALDMFEMISRRFFC